MATKGTQSSESYETVVYGKPPESLKPLTGGLKSTHKHPSLNSITAVELLPTGEIEYFSPSWRVRFIPNFTLHSAQLLEGEGLQILRGSDGETGLSFDGTSSHHFFVYGNAPTSSKLILKLKQIQGSTSLEYDPIVKFVAFKDQEGKPLLAYSSPEVIQPSGERVTVPVEWDEKESGIVITLPARMSPLIVQFAISAQVASVIDEDDEGDVEQTESVKQTGPARLKAEDIARPAFTLKFPKFKLSKSWVSALYGPSSKDLKVVSRKHSELQQYHPTLSNLQVALERDGSVVYSTASWKVKLSTQDFPVASAGLFKRRALQLLRGEDAETGLSFDKNYSRHFFFFAASPPAQLKLRVTLLQGDTSLSIDPKKEFIAFRGANNKSILAYSSPVVLLANSKAVFLPIEFDGESSIVVNIPPAFQAPPLVIAFGISSEAPRTTRDLHAAFPSIHIHSLRFTPEDLSSSSDEGDGPAREIKIGLPSFLHSSLPFGKWIKSLYGDPDAPTRVAKRGCSVACIFASLNNVRIGLARDGEAEFSANNWRLKFTPSVIPTKSKLYQRDGIQLLRGIDGETGIAYDGVSIRNYFFFNKHPGSRFNMRLELLEGSIGVACIPGSFVGFTDEQQKSLLVYLAPVIVLPGKQPIKLGVTWEAETNSIATTIPENISLPFILSFSIERNPASESQYDVDDIDDVVESILPGQSVFEFTQGLGAQLLNHSDTGDLIPSPRPTTVQSELNTPPASAHTTDTLGKPSTAVRKARAQEKFTEGTTQLAEEERAAEERAQAREMLAAEEREAEERAEERANRQAQVGSRPAGADVPTWRSTSARPTLSPPKFEPTKKVIVASNQHVVADIKKVEDIVRECKANNIKYTDTTFPPEAMVLRDKKCYVGEESTGISLPVRYVRISDLKEAGVFKSKAPKPIDVHQGRIGTCYLLGSLAVASTQPYLIDNLFIAYDVDVGVYEIQFFIDGYPQVVIIDDFIAVDDEYRIIYGASVIEQEFWVSLVEKAYAKLHSCYQHVHGGVQEYALCDITGGIVTQHQLALPIVTSCIAGLWKGTWQNCTTQAREPIQLFLAVGDSFLGGGKIDDMRWRLAGQWTKDTPKIYSNLEAVQEYGRCTLRSDGITLHVELFFDVNENTLEGRWLHEARNTTGIIYLKYFAGTSSLSGAKQQLERDTWASLVSANKEKAIMTCAITEPNTTETNHKGIIKNHAYGVIDVFKSGHEKLVKLMNPHGEGGYEPCNYKPPKDGEFYMDFLDFRNTFTTVDVCTIFDERWQMATITTLVNDFKKSPGYELIIPEAARVIIKVTQCNSKLYIGDDVYPEMIGCALRCVNREEIVSWADQGAKVLLRKAKERSVHASVVLPPTTDESAFVVYGFAPETKINIPITITVYATCQFELQQVIRKADFKHGTSEIHKLVSKCLTDDLEQYRTGLRNYFCTSSQLVDTEVWQSQQKLKIKENSDNQQLTNTMKGPTRAENMSSSRLRPVFGAQEDLTSRKSLRALLKQ